MNILHVLTRQRLIGNIGERAVCRYLKRRGYKILECNYVASGHEIDVICENKEYICFTEVKTKTLKDNVPSQLRPALAVNKRKRNSIVSASHLFAAVHRSKGKSFRFDVAEVYLNERGKVIEINYMESAFSLNDI